MKETLVWWQGSLPELSGCPHYKELEMDYGYWESNGWHRNSRPWR